MHAFTFLHENFHFTQSKIIIVVAVILDEDHFALKPARMAIISLVNTVETHRPCVLWCVESGAGEREATCRGERKKQQGIFKIESLKINEM